MYLFEAILISHCLQAFFISLCHQLYEKHTLLLSAFLTYTFSHFLSLSFHIQFLHPNVIRLGDNLPFGQNLQSLFLSACVVFGKIHAWANFHCCSSVNGQILNKWTSHPVTLTASHISPSQTFLIHSFDCPFSIIFYWTQSVINTLHQTFSHFHFMDHSRSYFRLVSVFTSNIIRQQINVQINLLAGNRNLTYPSECPT